MSATIDWLKLIVLVLLAIGSLSVNQVLLKGDINKLLDGDLSAIEEAFK